MYISRIGFCGIVLCSVVACGGSSESDDTSTNGTNESSNSDSSAINFEGLTLAEKGSLTSGKEYLIIQDFNANKTFTEYTNDSEIRGTQVSEVFSGTWDFSGNVLTLYYSDGATDSYEVSVSDGHYSLTQDNDTFVMEQTRALSTTDISDEYQLTFAGSSVTDTVKFNSNGSCEFIGVDGSFPCEWQISNNTVVITYPGYSESDRAWLIDSAGSLAYVSEDQLSPLVVSIGTARPSR